MIEAVNTTQLLAVTTDSALSPAPNSRRRSASKMRSSSTSTNTPSAPVAPAATTIRCRRALSRPPSIAAVATVPLSSRIEGRPP